MAREERELTDARWAVLKPLLPPQRPTTGRPNKDHRQVLEAIVWLLRTGAPWRDLPDSFGPWRTVASRFYRWRRQGVFDRLLAEITRLADVVGELDWLVHYGTAAWSAPTSTPPAHHASRAWRTARGKRTAAG